MEKKHSQLKEYALKTTKAPSTKKERKYKIKALAAIKTQLAAAKSKLDAQFIKPKFNLFWTNFDPFKYERYNIATLGNTDNISNAWLKCIELLTAYNLVDNIQKTDAKFIHFDNAAFPGSFILATHHLINTMYPIHASKYTWHASSLLNANDQNASPLEDKYKLYKLYKNNWLMSEHNNGDVLDEENQMDFYRKLGGKVDLYTSDLGFDVSADYNNQEIMQHQANIGQILSGLLTLKAGGSFITKQYTTFEPSSCAIMYATAHFFEEFYLCKPYTSRMANSETYLVGKGFIMSKSPIIQHPYIIAMFDRITSRINSDIPMFEVNDFPVQFLKTIIHSAQELSDCQIKKIELDIERATECLSDKYRGPHKDHPIIKEFHEQVEPSIEEWYRINPILAIQDTKRLTATQLA